MVSDSRLVLSRDHDPSTLRRQLRAGELVRLRRGAYVAQADGAGDASAAARSERARNVALDRLHAVRSSLSAPYVISHTSAALLWGLPVWTVPATTHLRQKSRPGGDRARDIDRHLGLPQTWVELDGCPVTDLPSTVVDCLLTLPVLDGLVIADAALARGVMVPELEELVTRRGRRNGKARAATVLSLADAGSESAWETWLRYVALSVGLPRPVTQFPVTTHLGTFRLDLAWPGYRVLAEFDGAVKYVDGAFGATYDGRKAVLAEKRREDAIAEALGVRPLRAVAADARDAGALARRLIARFPDSVRADLRPDRRLPFP